MKAVRFVGPGRPPEVVDLARPDPGPGEVLVRIGGAGVCHSDLHILDGEVPVAGQFTLGHENAGWIEALGAGVKGWAEGKAVAVYGPWGCGLCHHCQLSAENYCENHASIPSHGGGIGVDGGMADYMIVPSARLLVPLGGLDPAEAAPLGDAALTPYHAIRRAMPRLTPGATALVIGVGGLGHMAVQLLKVLTGARIIAADIDPAKRAQAKALGADLVIDSSTATAAEEIRDHVGARGLAAAFDMVGIQPTIDLAQGLMGRDGEMAVIGLGGGTIHYQGNLPAYGTHVSLPNWGTRAELIEVIALAQSGRIHSEVERFPLVDAPAVYERLRAGQIRGRAVLVP